MSGSAMPFGPTYSSGGFVPACEEGAQGCAEGRNKDGWPVLTTDGSSGDVGLEMAVASRMAELFRLFKDRQRKYGPGNIAAFGDMGVAVRAQDKLARLRHFYFAGGAGDMPDESVNDAWSDLAVYAVIALVCRDGLWPGTDLRARSAKGK